MTMLLRTEDGRLTSAGIEIKYIVRGIFQKERAVLDAHADITCGITVIGVRQDQAS